MTPFFTCHTFIVFYSYLSCYCHLGTVHHLLHLDPQQLRDVKLGEDEDRPEEEDVDGQDDNVDVDPCL